MDTGQVQPSVKICFAVLVHNKREVVQDMLDNIRFYCPHSSIVLFNGGSQRDLCDNLGYPVCPASRKLTYGVTAVYLLEVMEWLESINFDYDYLINLDSDALFVREGYENFIEQEMKNSDYMGVDVFVRDRNWYCGEQLKKEWQRWKPLLLTDTFIGAFNVGQVQSRRLVRRLLSWEQFAYLKNNLLHTKAYGIDEIIYVMMADRFGFKPKSYPKEPGLPVRYRPHYRYQEIIRIINERLNSFVVHPIKRKMKDEARTLVRCLRWRAARKQEKMPDYVNLKAVSIIRSRYGNLEIITRTNNRLIHAWRDEQRKNWHRNPPFASGVSGTPFFTESRDGNFHVIAPLIKGGIGHWWRDNRRSRKSWYGPATFGKRQMNVVSLMNTRRKQLVAVVEKDGHLRSYKSRHGRWKSN
ncbi:hypothetical protein SD71_04575 [Cohnella kolymensis]|uniref:Glycosyltransferase n=1 Tax=Cohnella kolymensis TaxID=1590652 RepID=A0ABR5A7C6_9BACL|nr:hypothetical protein [Cohnella kolymensis]KIL36976.1 hypothetical protein SD71_04575 [Cohnella kolymensis]